MGRRFLAARCSWKNKGHKKTALAGGSSGGLFVLVEVAVVVNQVCGNDYLIFDDAVLACLDSDDEGGCEQGDGQNGGEDGLLHGEFLSPRHADRSASVVRS